MLRLLFCCVLFFGLAPVSVFAAEEQVQQPMAPVHNEYHNSTIYSQQPGESSRDPYEGIHVYIDPETGDRVVSVRSRRDPDPQPQQPFYIAPVVRP
ncbi:MAG: hypothetical protein K6G15_10695 [Desulfovibrio sp.]|nr:hypothetical protein [Desulfovibrio sp.]